MNQTPYKEAKQINKIDELRIWCIARKIFSTTDVKQWGYENFYTSADVRCRELVRIGFLRAMPQNEAIERNLNKKGNAHVRWYEVL